MNYISLGMEILRIVKAVELYEGRSRIPVENLREAFNLIGYSIDNLRAYDRLGYVSVDNMCVELTDKGREVLEIKNEYKFLMKNGVYVEKSLNGRSLATSLTDNNVLNLPRGYKDIVSNCLNEADGNSVFISECPVECSKASSKAKKVVKID